MLQCYPVSVPFFKLAGMTGDNKYFQGVQPHISHNLIAYFNQGDRDIGNWWAHKRKEKKRKAIQYLLSIQHSNC